MKDVLDPISPGAIDVGDTTSEQAGESKGEPWN